MILDIIVFLLIGLGMLFAIIRLIKGPTMANRIVSLDTFNIIVIGVIVFLAHQFENSLYLDIAIVYAILAFLETIVFARYLEGKNGNS
ncbi:Putative monovalent cation/H+ antiporter subunit F [Candidatus Izimaplasma bacterium HR1]|jgi:multicomponent Na+:H+ antiporter subunit F|uniref:monovalent cation/H+ antiporter complex subunit F n=1 Tax=Candidatus Izimoplasma sp. HR1 TaxID=1541959 RepID=UPI0004F7A012|nr:Putative monovalent cation/H+ antiporter subunit F [Candidatus Izimaplasma bacterium HR1]